MLKAILFDCDGVIAETEGDGHRVAFNEAFKQMEINAFWDEDLYGELLQIGGGKERMQHFFNSNPDKYPKAEFSETFIKEIHKLKTQLFMNLCADLPPRPGVKRIMLEAADKGIKVFVCSTSNEKSVTAIVSHLLGNDKDRVIEHIYAGDVVEHKKPAPDVFLKIPQNYSIKPEECFVVEDTRIGLLAAKAAGMFCIVTTSLYSQGEDFKEADVVVDSLGEENVNCLPKKGLQKSTAYVTVEGLKDIVNKS